MDGIRFILEDPQAANSRQKKRSRLVTACDTCRAKKIKCHQSQGVPKCEACRLSKSACRFRDRERYHAQRSGSISASSSTFTPSDSEDAHSFTESPNPIARRATLPSLGHYHNQQSRSSSLPPAVPRMPSDIVAGHRLHRNRSPSSEVGPHRVRKNSRRLINPVASMDNMHATEGRYFPHSSPGTPGMSPLAGLQNLRLDDNAGDLSAFFDPRRLGYPSPKYMDHALDLFFDNFGPRFLFLHRDAVRHAMVELSLSSPFSNCIAALALRFSHSTEIACNSHVRLGEPYLEMAKDLIVPLVYNPSVEILHSLLLLSWGEYGSGRENGLNVYSALTVQMAMDLGLGNEDTIMSVPTEHEQTDLRQTWWSVVILDIISSWVTGNPPNLNFQGCTTALPPSSFLSSDPSSPPVLPYLTLHELLGLRDNLLHIVNFSFNTNVQPNFEADLQDVRSRLLAIQLSLPSHLDFNVVNLRRAFQDRQETVFVFLHLILNSLVAMSHFPALFRSLPAPPRIPDIVASSARTILDVVVMMEQVDMRAISAVPFLDFPLAIAARAFALESRADQEMTPSHEQMSVVTRGRFAEVSLGVCNNILTRLAEHWGNVHNVQMTVQTGTVWTYLCPVQQSPVAIPSALDLQGVETYSRVPQLQADEHEIALTYSDSDFSREPSPLLFDFPGLLHGERMHDTDYQRPASDPTPTTLLPPVSLAAGEVATYHDIPDFMAPYSDGGSSAGREEFFSAMHGGECMPSSVYEREESQDDDVRPPFQSSPWIIS